MINDFYHLKSSDEIIIFFKDNWRLKHFFIDDPTIKNEKLCFLYDPDKDIKYNIFLKKFI